MNEATKVITFLEGAGMVIALIIIVFLIIRRRKIRKKETFDKRSN